MGRMTSVAIISPRTAAKTDTFVVTKGGARLSATNLAGAEEVDLKVLDDGVATIAYDSTGTAIKLTATKPQVVIDAPGEYQVLKDATVGSSGVYLVEPQ